MKSIKKLVQQQKFRYDEDIDKKSDYFVENNLVDNLHYNGGDQVEATVNDKIKRYASFYVLQDFIITGCSCPSSQPCEHSIALIKYYKNHLDDMVTSYIPDISDLFTHLNGGYESKNFYLDVNNKFNFIKTCNYVNNLLQEFYNKKYYNYFIKLFYNYFIVLIKVSASKQTKNDYYKQFDSFISTNLSRISICYESFFEYYKKCLKKNIYLFSVVNAKVLSELIDSEYINNLNENNVLSYIGYIEKNLNQEFLNGSHYSGYNIAKESLEKITYYYNKKMIESNNVDVIEKIKSNLDDSINRQAYLEYLLNNEDFDKILEIYNKYNNDSDTFLSIFCYLKCLEHFKEINELLIKMLNTLKFKSYTFNDALLLLKNFSSYLTDDLWLDIGGAIFSNCHTHSFLKKIITIYPILSFYNDAIVDFKEIDDKFTIYKGLHNKELCYIYHSKIVDLIPSDGNYIDRYNITRIRGYVDKLLLLLNGYYFAVDAINTATSRCFSYALEDIKRYLDYRRAK